LLLLNGIFLFILATASVVQNDIPFLLRPRYTEQISDLIDTSAAILEANNFAGKVRGGHNVPWDNVTSFNIIMTSNGDRPTLQSALESILPQLTKWDFITVITEGVYTLSVAEVFINVPCNCTKIFIQNSEILGWWGHGSRTRWQKLLPGTYHMNADDDDLYTPNAMAIVRHWVRDLNHTMYVFRMIRRWDDRVETIPAKWVTNGTMIKAGNVGTPCVVYRADRDRLPAWSTRYGGDGDFYTGLKKIMKAVVVVPEVIYHVGQREDFLPLVNTILRGLPAEPEEAIKARRERRRHDPDVPSIQLPPPQWIGTTSKEKTGWIPASDAPSVPNSAAMLKLEREHQYHLQTLEREERDRLDNIEKLARAAKLALEKKAATSGA
jgi:hypothetical protein